MGKFDLPDLVDIMSFEQVERSLIRLIRTKMVSHAECSIDELKSIIARRKDGHWAKVSLDHYSSKGNIYFTAYTTLEASLDLMALRQEYDPGFAMEAKIFKIFTYRPCQGARFMKDFCLSR